MARPLLALCLGVTLASSACSTSETSTTQPLVPGLVKMEITPVDIALIIDGATPAKTDFKALGTFSDMRVNDVSKQIVWTVEDTGLGVLGAESIAGRFLSSTNRGGRTTITASAPPVPDAKATVTLTYRAALARAGTPDKVYDMFQMAAEDGSERPTLLGPTDGVTMDKTKPSAFTWMAAAGTDLFELTFSNEFTDVHLYTTEVSLTPTAEEWSILTATNAGGTVDVKLRGMKSANPKTAGSAPTIKVGFKI